MQNEQNSRPPRLIALPEVSAITTLGKTSIYELIAAGELRPVKLGRKTVFAECEIYEWVNNRVASRQGDSTKETSKSPAGIKAGNLQKKLINKARVVIGPQREAGHG